MTLVSCLVFLFYCVFSYSLSLHAPLQINSIILHLHLRLKQVTTQQERVSCSLPVIVESVPEFEIKKMTGVRNLKNFYKKGPIESVGIRFFNGYLQKIFKKKMWKNY
jgi:hypothetical protein